MTETSACPESGSAAHRTACSSTGRCGPLEARLAQLDAQHHAHLVAGDVDEADRIDDEVR